MKILIQGLFAVVLCLVSAGPALANYKTFNIQWSGASLGNSATATGFITFDTSVLPEITSDQGSEFSSPTVSDLGITITGASMGNGTYGLADFSYIVFYAPSALDLTTELIGQTLDNGCPYGTSTGTCGDGVAGDFNLFSFSGPTGLGEVGPQGTYYFQLNTAFDGDSGAPLGDDMLVTSMTPAVPEPASLLLVGSMLVGLVGIRKVGHR